MHNIKVDVETINCNKFDPVIKWDPNFATIVFTFSFIKKLRIPSLVWSIYFI